MKLNKSDLEYLVNKEIKRLASKLNKTPAFILKLYESGMTFEEIEKNSKSLEEMMPEPSKADELIELRLSERELEKLAPKTGFENLDWHIKGFIPTRVYILSGETNSGKSSLAVNFAVNVAKQNKKVLYLALEPGNTIVEYVSSVYLKKSFNELTKEDLEKIKDLSIDFYTEEIKTIEALKKSLDELDRYDFIIIDHIGYFVTSVKNTTQVQANLMKKIVQFAKEKKTAILLIAHLNKSISKNKKITMDRITGSAAFKQDATDVLLITRDQKDDFSFLNTGKLFISKTKSGSTGTIELVFYTGKALITEKNEFMPF